MRRFFEGPGPQSLRRAPKDLAASAMNAFQGCRHDLDLVCSVVPSYGCPGCSGTKSPADSLRSNSREGE